jgi:hypothetical protein
MKTHAGPKSLWVCSGMTIACLSGRPRPDCGSAISRPVDVFHFRQKSRWFHPQCIRNGANRIQGRRSQPAFDPRHIAHRQAGFVRKLNLAEFEFFPSFLHSQAETGYSVTHSSLLSQPQWLAQGSLQYTTRHICLVCVSPKSLVLQISRLCKEALTLGIALHDKEMGIPMNTSPSRVPEEGIRIDPHQHLFLVDVEHPDGEHHDHERRAFLDLGAAVDFIGKRDARLCAYVSAVGLATEGMFFAAVTEAFESRRSKTYLLRFASSPSLLLKSPSSSAESEFEPFQRIYPCLGS